MFLANFVKNSFSSALEILSIKPKQAKILIMGLDNSGKTTLVVRLRQDVLHELEPTMYPYTEEVVLSGVKYKLWDLGGIKNHKIWKDYIYGADAIIYMIDASDHSRLK